MVCQAITATGNQSVLNISSCEQCCMTCITTFSCFETDGPVVNDKLKDARLSDIAEDLGRDWKPLGRKLGLSTNILENIDLNNRKVKEKAFRMMSRWKKLNADSATGQVLADALITIGRKDVAERLAGMLKYLPL